MSSGTDNNGDRNNPFGLVLISAIAQ